MPAVEFWFEFASTYSYPAALRIEGAAAEAGVEIEWKPFLLGPVFAAQGWNDSPFNLYPAKGAYMWRDMERICADQGIPFQRPTQFPRNGLNAARVALLGAGERWGPAFVRAVFHTNFAEDKDISQPFVLAGLLEPFGLDGMAMLERSKQPEVKEALRAQTERAMDLGIFGAPSFRIGDELFWGNDRLETALEWAKRNG